MAQAYCQRPLVAEVMVQNRVSQWRISGRQSRTKKEPSPSVLVSPNQYYSTHAPKFLINSFIHHRYYIILATECVFD